MTLLVMFMRAQTHWMSMVEFMSSVYQLCVNLIVPCVCLSDVYIYTHYYYYPEQFPSLYRWDQCLFCEYERVIIRQPQVSASGKSTAYQLFLKDYVVRYCIYVPAYRYGCQKLDQPFCSPWISWFGIKKVETAYKFQITFEENRELAQWCGGFRWLKSEKYKTHQDSANDPAGIIPEVDREENQLSLGTVMPSISIFFGAYDLPSHQQPQSYIRNMFAFFNQLCIVD